MNTSRNGRGATSPCEVATTAVDVGAHAALPRIVLFGGQDAPTIEQLVSRWWFGIARELPPHQLCVAAWPRGHGDLQRHATMVRTTIWSDRESDAALSCEPSAPHDSSTRSWIDRRVSGLATRTVRELETRMQCARNGQPGDLMSHAVYLFTRFSVDALYDRDAFGNTLINLATRALASSCCKSSSTRATLIVAHSFGGTLALRAAWELVRSGQTTERQFHLVTLGTACGPMVVESPMFAPLPRERGCIVLPSNLLTWQHFYSESDALVAAPALPNAFNGVRMERVDTGGFLTRGRGHALPAYLRTPEVTRALARMLR